MNPIRTQSTYKRRKKATVELTSLLDLLFVMIFVSLIQQKQVTKTVEPTKKGKVTKVKIDPKPVPVVKEQVPVKPTKVNHSVSALFYFYPTASNPNIPTGSYRMQGNYNTKSGTLSIGGISWVNRPKDYDMVPLSGKIAPNSDVFTGRIEFIGCKQFTLRRKSKGSSTPISGSWEGIYDCSQGQTGLTLTID